MLHFTWISISIINMNSFFFLCIVFIVNEQEKKGYHLYFDVNQVILLKISTLCFNSFIKHVCNWHNNVITILEERISNSIFKKIIGIQRKTNRVLAFIIVVWSNITFFRRRKILHNFLLSRTISSNGKFFTIFSLLLNFIAVFYRQNWGKLYSKTIKIIIN
jgi:hypothetical protein